MRNVLLTAICLFALLFSVDAMAGQRFEAGAGFGDMGAVQGSMEWHPALQGSRKQVPVLAGWRYIGEGRVYWSPSVRLDYYNWWSIGGAGNNLAVALAPAGLGVYLTPPPAGMKPEERKGRWFITADINLSLEIGGNITPGSPQNSEIPDPDAYREKLKKEIKENGGLKPGTMISQRYPFGAYQFVSLAIPVHFDFWNMVTEKVGVGFFIESDVAIFEWPLGSYANSTPSFGYSMKAGLSVTLF
jgi:hypothetical protein